MFINCMHQYMAWSLFWNKKIEIVKKIVFLIKMAPLEIDSFNFGNS
jgi:hypothetical protein